MFRRFQITFDANDPNHLADFWAEALGYILQPPPKGYESWEAFADAHGMSEEDRTKYAAVVDPHDEGPRLLFQKVPEGKTAKNRVHLDVGVSGGPETDPAEGRARIEERVLELTAAGATEVARHEEYGHGWVVMQDPEGNEFCLT